jgi:hypothetical protein
MGVEMLIQMLGGQPLYAIQRVKEMEEPLEWQVYQDKVEAAGLQEKKIDFGLARVRQKGVAAESGVSKPQV